MGSINSFNLDLTTILSILTFVIFHCGCKKKAKDLKPAVNPPAESVAEAKPEAPPKPPPVKQPETTQGDEASIKTDKTQEETETTQDLTNVGEDQIPEISPYPFEIFNRGLGKKKKKHRHGNEGGGNHVSTTS